MNFTISPAITALVSVILFSTGGLVIKWMPLPPLALSGSRALVAAITLAIYIRVQFPHLKLVAFNPVKCLVILSYVVMTICYVFAMKLTTAANAIFLQYTMPAWVLLGGALWLAERVTPSRVLAILLSLIGMLLFFKDELDPTQWQGNILALISGIAFAGVVLGIRRDRDHNPIRSVFWGNLLTALIVIPFALIYDSSVFTPMFDYRSILGLLWLGIFQMALAYVLYVNAISHLPAIEVAILSLIEPVLNPAWVYIAIGETPSFWALIGSSLILLSVLLRALLAEPNQPDEPSQPNST
jgi:drug/metabolite transporter (DMT)-like permease